VPEFTLSGIAQHVGKELGVSSWVTVDQSRINQFAECSGDRQWIHVDVERAKRESPYRAPIAHGYLTLALVAPLQMEIGAVPTDAGAAFNYGLDKVRFLAPALLQRQSQKMEDGDKLDPISFMGQYRKER
jgi:acyl dehydratase